jgi:hypothetical protein
LVARNSASEIHEELVLFPLLGSLLKGTFPDVRVTRVRVEPRLESSQKSVRYDWSRATRRSLGSRMQTIWRTSSCMGHATKKIA